MRTKYVLNFSHTNKIDLLPHLIGILDPTNEVAGPHLATSSVDKIYLAHYEEEINSAPKKP